MFHGRFVHVGKTLTDFQILGCELLDKKLQLMAVFALVC